MAASMLNPAPQMGECHGGSFPQEFREISIFLAPNALAIRFSPLHFDAFQMHVHEGLPTSEKSVWKSQEAQGGCQQC